ncbi:MAG TPA: CHRD domain-containing protein [Gaiellaceae bacterium]|jgi:Cu/Zn superoxide dismutase|nr:CHRD domain-containing protein [Gaiellaceae bacterium]
MGIRTATHAVAALVAVIVTASALAASSAPASRSVTTARLKAFLTVNQEIPTPKGAKGSGTFTATVTGRKIKFRLTYTGLTGAATGAHIHVALAGRANPVPAVTLCGPCRSGQTRTVTASAVVMKKILGGGTYVNIHTPKNAGGEIRGQIAST